MFEQTSEDHEQSTLRQCRCACMFDVNTCNVFRVSMHERTHYYFIGRTPIERWPSALIEWRPRTFMWERTIALCVAWTEYTYIIINIIKYTYSPQSTHTHTYILYQNFDTCVMCAYGWNGRPWMSNVYLFCVGSAFSVHATHERNWQHTHCFRKRW